MQGLADGGLAEGTTMPINKLHHHTVGLFMAFGFPGPSVKGSDPMRQPVD